MINNIFGSNNKQYIGFYYDYTKYKTNFCNAIFFHKIKVKKFFLV